MEGIFCIGQAVFDVTLPYSGPLKSNGKYRVRRPHGCSGAPALNAACLCALWGAPTELVARVGRDRYGQLIEADLVRCGVGTRYLLRTECAPTSYSIIAVDDQSGDRAIFNVVEKDSEYGCGMRAQRACVAESCMSYAEVCDFPIPTEAPDVILADGHEAKAALSYLRAHPSAISVVDAGTFRQDTYEVAQHVDYLVCSEDFAKQYRGARLIDPNDLFEIDALLTQIEQINSGVAVITLGDRGLIYRDRAGDPHHLPAHPAVAVDTTGAGDVFHGAFAHGLLSGMSLESNLVRASMAASIAVRSIGGLSSIPALEAVMEELS
ncbi:PfkB domain protein [Coriobacterium glomerans PW2]|uniref:PfkB domain protein n=1 Tax=Coriobacterium glomerans (strain ATCC 49209 / DSM 20642 / JCM 10262 / PW2) TaxID=700015 RepID=F2N9Y8_CORGP|nr:PfkB family carbohydrate kinase [Coriobacterium glomerans]AEB06243.1 PfkB domain protein [Coriobacterium glomerans PW2]